MTGSSLVPVVVPIVVVLGMFAWLGLVFYAAAHPEWKRHAGSAGSAAGASRPGASALPAERDLAAVTGRANGAADSAPARGGKTQPPAAPPRRAA
jgi:hypothetical protein